MKKIFVILISVLLSTSSLASGGDQKVNCSTHVTEIPVYEGWASCFDTFSGRRLERYFPPSYSSSQTIIECTYMNGRPMCFSCLAVNIPFIGYEVRETEACDYTPKAVPGVKKFAYKPAGPANFWLVEMSGHGSSDRDGRIVKYEWIIDGQYYTGVAPVIRLHSYPSPYGSRVTLTVTDDDGYTHSVTKTLALGLH